MEHAAPVAAISIILLGAGMFIAYNFYNIKYQSPVVLPNTSARLNLFVTTYQSLMVNLTSLVVYFSEIDIHSVGANGTWNKLFSSPTSVDLTKVVNVTQTLGSFDIAPGSYDLLRVAVNQASETFSPTVTTTTTTTTSIVTSSTVTTTSTITSTATSTATSSVTNKIMLAVPASAQTGLSVPLSSQFNLPSGSTGGITLTLSVDSAALHSGSLNLTISTTLVLGMGVSKGTTTTSSSTTTTNITTTNKTCYWPFCG